MGETITCDRCNTDMHVCGGCGASVPHGRRICDRCIDDEDMRQVGFFGFADCSLSDCPTTFLCSEKGSCRAHDPVGEIGLTGHIKVMSEGRSPVPATTEEVPTDG